jgi:pyruvate-formate lyase-activating enzyme
MAYHRPLNYSFGDVEKSIAYAQDKGVKVSLNLLIFPGFTDREDEIEDLLYFLEGNHIDMVQLRNLNIDPDYLNSNFSGKSGIGILNFINLLKEELPGLKIRSYSQPLD